jgi:hypothetical protein
VEAIPEHADGSARFTGRGLLDQRDLLADHHVDVVHPDATLLHNRKASSAQFKRQRNSYSPFQESDATRIEHRERATDQPSRQFSQPIVICVHQRKSACISVSKSSFTMLPTG